MGGSSSPKQTSTLSKSQQVVDNQIARQIRAGLNAPIQTYEAPITAALDPVYGNIYRNIEELSKTVGQKDPAVDSALKDLLSGKGKYDLSPERTERYIKDSVLTPALRAYDSEILPRLNQSFAVGGRSFSGQRLNVQGKLLENILTTGQAELGKAQLSNMQLAAQLDNDAAQRQVSGIQLATQVQNQPFDRLRSLQEALNPYQSYAQNVSTENYNKWTEKQGYNNPWLKLGLSYVDQSKVAMYNPQNPLRDALINSGVQAGFGAIGSIGGPGGALAGSQFGALLTGAATGGSKGFGGRG